MNKIGIAVLSSLATLGIGTGAVAIIGNTPNTKDLLNISWQGTQVVGNNVSTEKINLEKIDELEILKNNNELEIMKLTTENAELNNQILSLSVDLSDYEEQVELLNNRIEQNNNRISELETENINFESTILETI